MPWEKQFEPSEALNGAMNAFWAGGYEGTCLNSLLEQMGIQKGSFYATFGGKHEVLLDALQAYVQSRGEMFAKLQEEPSPREALERHLRELFAEGCSNEGEKGCFVVNIAVELASKDEAVRKIVQQALEAHERQYRLMLEAAAAKGEIAMSIDPRKTARALIALIIGMRVMARATIPRAVLDSLRDQALDLIAANRAV